MAKTAAMAETMTVTTAEMAAAVMAGTTMTAVATGTTMMMVAVTRDCKGNLTDLRRILHLSLAKGNPK
jgi:hypothetical protein